MKRYLAIDSRELERRNCLWTAREIAQQPRVWRQAHARIDSLRHCIDAWLAPALALPNLRILLCGAGTSAFIGDTAAPWLRKRWQAAPTARIASVSTTELTADPAQYFSQDLPTLMVSFARSGDSPESIACVELADQLSSWCRHLILTCNPAGRLAQLAPAAENALCLFMPEETNDRSFAMTSSYTAMLVSCLAIFTPDTRQLEQAADIAQHVLDHRSPDIAALARRDFDRLVVLGAGCLRGTAREAALKCLELTAGRVVAIHDSPLGFRHGPKIVINDSTLVIHLRSSDPYTGLYDRDLLSELRRDGRSAGIVELSADALAGGAAAGREAACAGEGTRAEGDTRVRGGAATREAVRTGKLAQADEVARGGGAEPASEAVRAGNAGALPLDDEASRAGNVGALALDDAWLSLTYAVYCQLLAFHKAMSLGVAADSPCPSGEVNRVVDGVTIYPFADRDLFAGLGPFANRRPVAGHGPSTGRSPTAGHSPTTDRSLATGHGPVAERGKLSPGKRD